MERINILIIVVVEDDVIVAIIVIQNLSVADIWFLSKLDILFDEVKCVIIYVVKVFKVLLLRFGFKNTQPIDQGSWELVVLCHVFIYLLEMNIYFRDYDILDLLEGVLMILVFFFNFVNN